MDNDTRTPRRVNFLLRRVVVPGWLQVIMYIMWLCVAIRLLMTSPLLVALALAGYIALNALVLNPLRRRAGQGTPADDQAEVRKAPTMEAVLTVVWRQVRTYPVWLLIVIALAMIDVALGMMGYPSI